MATAASDTASQDNSYQTVIAIVVAMVLVNVAVFLRLLARKLMKLPLMADDYMIMVAALFVNADAILYPFSIRYGDGRHIETLSPHDITSYLKTIYISAQLYGVSITAVKLSVLLFYRRVFSTAPFRRRIIVLAILVLAWFVVNNLLGAFQCIPVRKAWEPEIPGRCINFLDFFIGIQVPNIILDALILALPVRAVLQLQMSKKKKISVLAVFLLGGFSIIIAIVRLAVLITRIGKQDLTYSTAIGDWSLIEPAVEVLSASLPTMTVFYNVRQHFATLLSVLRSSTRGAKGSKDGSRGFHEIQSPGMQHLPSGPVTAIAGLDGRTERERDVPMHAIAVRQEVQWDERSRKGDDVV
ncbi:hypothetical protein G7Y79_00024g055880 [Physcia stellaris]|nr:hypothetical protein G7Y79_00024g055880 [Physcia stellaris]